MRQAPAPEPLQSITLQSINGGCLGRQFGAKRLHDGKRGTQCRISIPTLVGRLNRILESTTEPESPFLAGRAGRPRRPRPGAHHQWLVWGVKGRGSPAAGHAPDLAASCGCGWQKGGSPPAGAMAGGYWAANIEAWRWLGGFPICTAVARRAAATPAPRRLQLRTRSRFKRGGRPMSAYRQAMRQKNCTAASTASPHRALELKTYASVWIGQGNPPRQR